MKRSAKIWLWVALVLCAATTVLNLTEGRIPSVVIALVSLVGLAVLLFAQKKAAYILMCCCYVLSFLVAVSGNLSAGNPVVILVMSLIGSLLVPVITWLFIRSDWKQLG